MPKLDVDLRLFDRETTKLKSLATNINTLSPLHQKFVAEIMLLRLFSLLENSLYSILTKIACGAKYLDGSSPLLKIKATSFANATNLFQNHGRPKPKLFLKWTIVKEIKKNVNYVINDTDNLFTILNNYSSLLAEIRRVRNRIAHNNSDSRKHYRNIVRKHYGAYLNNITPGTLLLTHRKSPFLLHQYITKTRIFISDLVIK